MVKRRLARKLTNNDTMAEGGERENMQFKLVPHLFGSIRSSPFGTRADDALFSCAVAYKTVAGSYGPSAVIQCLESLKNECSHFVLKT